MRFKRIKFLGLLALLVFITAMMIACDMGSDVNSPVSEATISAEQAESTGFDIFRARMSNIRFLIEGLEEGILTFTTKEGRTVPEEVEFTGGEATVENLFSKAEAETLIVTVKNFKGAEVDQIFITLEEVGLDDSVEVLADNFYGFFVPGKWVNPDYEWTYLAAGYIRELEWDKVTAIIGHLNDNVDSSFFVDSLVRGKYDTWRRYRAGSLLENEFDDFFADEVIADYYEAAKDEDFKVPVYAVTVNYKEEKGEVKGYGEFEKGEEVELTAIPNEGYEFTEWTGNKKSTEVTISFDMPGEDVELTAVFEEKKYEIEIIRVGEGEVKSQLISTQEASIQEVKEYPYESEVKLTAIPEDGWYFDSWEGELQEEDDNTATIFLDSDKKIIVTFLEYASQNGDIDVIHNFPTSRVDNFASETLTSSVLKEDDGSNETKIEHKENQLILRFADKIPQKERLETLSELNYEIIDKNSVLNAYLVELPESAKEGRVRSQNISGIKYAELNHIVEKSYIEHPNDEYFDIQWHYAQIRLPQTWYQTTGCDSVRVAVLDTGLDINHPDLGGNVDEKYGYNFVNDNKDFADYDGHGTHVAGTIGADTDNFKGVAGVMWEVDLLPVKVMEEDTGSIWDLVDGLLYAAGLLDSPYNPYPADVINLSLGTKQESQYLSDSINKIASKTDAIMVGAAGNDQGGPIRYPAALPEVIAVGAVDYNYPNEPQQAPYSNEGPEMDVVAPGGNMNVDSNNNNLPDVVWSTSFDEYEYLYKAMQGTSMSAPHVTGVIGLMLSEGIPHNEIRNILHQTAIDLGSRGQNEKYGYGLINAYWAVNEATEMKIAVGELEENTIKTIDKSIISSRGGEFKLDSIPEGYYRVFAWVDIRKNEIIEPGDYFGMSDILKFEAGESYYLEGYVTEVKEEFGKIEALEDYLNVKLERQ